MAKLDGSCYLSSIIKEYPPLTVEEERSLIEKMRKENKIEELRNLLVLHNSAFVFSMAKKFAWAFTTFDDAISVGMECMVECSRLFQLDRGARFITYSHEAVKRRYTRKINESLYEQRRTIHGDKDILEDENDGVRLIDMVQGARDRASQDVFHSVDETIDRKDTLDFFIKMCKKARIKDRDIKMIYHHYANEMNLRDIGKIYGITAQAVQSKILNCMRRLRQSITRTIMTKDEYIEQMRKNLPPPRPFTWDRKYNMSGVFNAMLYDHDLKEYYKFMTEKKKMNPLVRSGNYDMVFPSLPDRR